MRKAALFYEYTPLDGDVFGKGRRERIAELTDLYPTVITRGNFAEQAAALRDVEVIFGTWGLFPFGAEHFEKMPQLRAVFYAAGNVKAFAQPLIEREIVLTSAWAMNAIATAQLVLGQILLTCRGYYRGARRYRELQDTAQARAFWRAGANGETIGLIGMGWVAQRLTEYLHQFGFHVITNDPYLSDERARQLGVRKVSLQDLFAQSYVVSNHIPDLPTTQGVLGRPLFEKMRDGATFINSGRGAQVIQPDLIAVLQARPDLTALLDVTHPEPLPKDSPLWSLPNVVVSPHMGGTIGDEVVRLADCAIEEFIAWNTNRALQYQVTKEIFATMG
jgi:phosphoglycerate dehydrogenase-like enzyme